MTSDSSLGRPIRAYIRKSSFAHNIEWIEKHLQHANLVVVIKADAYGHGLIQMAKTAGSRDLAVASADEAKRLIDAGINNRIWVLEGPFSKECLALSAAHTISWVVHSQWQVDLLLSDQTGQFNVPDYDIWLKIDTGMHRLGFDKQGLGNVLQRVNSSSELNLVGLMTHFASSDLPGDPSVESQLAEFKMALTENDLQSYDISVANSGAILYYRNQIDGWVRPGVMLYGGMPHPSQRAEVVGLKPVMSLQSEIMALKQVRQGESVGYGATWTAAKDSRIAIVAAGYGDGYPRHVANGTPVYINGFRVSIVGRVSMDMLAVDVTELSDVSIGDSVELWGEHIPVDEVAECANTIAYELLTGVTARVPRVYL